MTEWIEIEQRDYTKNVIALIFFPIGLTLMIGTTKLAEFYFSTPHTEGSQLFPYMTILFMTYFIAASTLFALLTAIGTDETKIVRHKITKYMKDNKLK